jgi:hypothetical protein
MHGVLDSVAGDKDVARVLGCRYVWDDEAVTVVMEDEAAGELVAAGDGGLGLVAGPVGVALSLGRRRGGFAFPF